MFKFQNIAILILRTPPHTSSYGASLFTITTNITTLRVVRVGPGVHMLVVLFAAAEAPLLAGVPEELEDGVEGSEDAGHDAPYELVRGELERNYQGPTRDTPMMHASHRSPQDLSFLLGPPWASSPPSSSPPFRGFSSSAMGYLYGEKV